MKAVKKLVVLISLGVIGSVAASASTPEQSYLKTCRKDPGMPVPVTVVSPAVGSEYTGSNVDVTFVVDTNGTPAEVSVKSETDSTLAEAIVDAVKQWKFKPAERNGAPVATRVVLPVKIVDAPLEGAAFASN